MKRVLFAVTLFCAATLYSSVSAADTMAYPTADKASFLIDYPPTWELTQAEEEGGYTLLTGPTGAELYFRTIPGSQEAMQQAILDTKSYLEETYSDVALGEAQDTTQHGLKGFFAGGSGTDEEGSEIGFVVGWYGLNDGTIGEIWFAAEKGDAAGSQEAGAIINSFRAP